MNLCFVLLRKKTGAKLFHGHGSVVSDNFGPEPLVKPMTVVVELDDIEEEDDLPIPLCSAVKILGAPLQFVPEGGHQPALTE